MVMQSVYMIFFWLLLCPLPSFACIRTTAPKAMNPLPKPAGAIVTGFVRPEDDNRHPPTKSVLERIDKGEKILVLVLESGFDFVCAIDKTISDMVKKITSQRCKGYHFIRSVRKAVSDEQDQQQPSVEPCDLHPQVHRLGPREGVQLA